MYLWCWEVYVIFSASIFICNCQKMSINTHFSHFYIENSYLFLDGQSGNYIPETKYSFNSYLNQIKTFIKHIFFSVFLYLLKTFWAGSGGFIKVFLIVTGCFIKTFRALTNYFVHAL